MHNLTFSPDFSRLFSISSTNENINLCPWTQSKADDEAAALLRWVETQKEMQRNVNKEWRFTCPGSCLFHVSFLEKVPGEFRHQLKATSKTKGFKAR